MIDYCSDSKAVKDVQDNSFLTYNLIYRKWNIDLAEIIMYILFSNGIIITSDDSEAEKTSNTSDRQSTSS